MPIVRHCLEDGKELSSPLRGAVRLKSPLARLNKRLTPEEQEAARKRIQEAARRPYVYDPYSPLLSEKQLSEFRPVNFDNMEERELAMQNQENHTFA